MARTSHQSVLHAGPGRRFCARLDMAVDDAQGGAGLVVSEVDVEAVAAGERPGGRMEGLEWCAQGSTGERCGPGSQGAGGTPECACDM